MNPLAAENEALHQFMLECQDEVTHGMAQERIGELLEWLKTREVLSAVECEMIVSAGPTHYQAESLLKILSARDAREHWIPLWNGIAKHAPQLHAKLYPTIGAKLGEAALAGLTPPKTSISSVSRTHSLKKHSTSSAGRSATNATVHATGNAAATTTDQVSVSSPEAWAGEQQTIEQLIQERNAARAERKEALAEVEAATAHRYHLEEQISSLKYSSEPLQAELNLLRDRLANTKMERDEAVQQKELYRDQRREAIEESQAVHRMLSGLQRSHQETREQMKKQMDFYEGELDRVRSRLQEYSTQEAKLFQAHLDVGRHRDVLIRLRHELDRSIPYEVKDGRLQVRAQPQGSGGDSGVHETRGGSSDVGHSGVCVYPCEMEVSLNVQDVEPGIVFDNGVFVRGLTPGYSAAMDGRVAVGDRLVEINGVSTNNLMTIGEMIHGCRRKLNLVLIRHLLIPKPFLSKLPQPASAGWPAGSHGRTPTSHPPPGTAATDGYYVDRASIASGSAEHASLCSQHSGLSIQSFHSMHDVMRGTHSMPNYYHASHLHTAARQPNGADRQQHAFLTGSVVAAMADNQRSFSPMSGSGTGMVSDPRSQQQQQQQQLLQQQQPAMTTAGAYMHPPTRHYSATDRHDILVKPTLIGGPGGPSVLEDTPGPATGLHHYTSVPDLAPHHLPGGHRPHHRHGTSAGLAPRLFDPSTVAATTRHARSSDSITQRMAAAADGPASPNSKAQSPTQRRSAARTYGQLSSSGSESSIVQAISSPVMPASGVVTNAGLSLSEPTPRIMPHSITIPPIELLQSSNGGRDTVPLKPTIMVNGSNVRQREITPMKLRAPREVLNELHSTGYSSTIAGMPGPSSRREVIVKRSSEEATLDGFMIRGGRGNGVFVSSTPSWMAEEGLVIGDRFVYIGGENVENATFEHCHFLIQCSLVYGSSLALIVENNVDGLRKLPEGARDNFYVRCEFNYARLDDGDLEISRGDVVNVVDTMHDDRTDSWFAYKMKGGQRTSVAGMVPSKNRASNLTVRRRSSQISRDLDVDEAQSLLHARGTSPKPGLRRGSLKANSFKLRNIFSKRNPSGDASSEYSTLPVPSLGPMTVKDNIPKGYSSVQLVTFKRPRPVLLLGVFARHIATHMLQDYSDTFYRAQPEMFSSSFAVKAGLENRSILKCDPPLEGDGSVSTGYQCITMQSITGDDRRHCIMEFQASFIDVLEQYDLHPVILFLQPKSEKKLRLLSMQVLASGTGSESTATSKDMYDNTMEELAKWKCRATGIIEVGTGIDRAMQRIVSKVQSCQRGQNWIPVRSDL